MNETDPSLAPLLNSQGSLPVKIAGLVFWGMVLIGLITAVIILRGERQVQLAHDQLAATELSRHLRALVSPAPGQPAWPRARLRRWLNIYGARGLILHANGRRLAIGTVSHAPVLFIHRTITSAAALHGILQADIAFPSLRQSLIVRRNRVMLGVGMTMVLFGLVLQAVLRELLSRPFSALVAAARRFADGDSRARMDETLADEFGFLAKFINRALDSGAAKQTELELALERAAASERALLAEKKRAEITLYSLTDAVITVDIAGRVQYLNPVAQRLVGHTSGDWEGRPITEVMHLVDEQTGASLSTALRGAFVPGATGPLRNAAVRASDGSLTAVDLSVAPMHDDSGKPIGAVFVFQDVSQARRMGRQLVHQATHDALTGLYNRGYFESALAALLDSDTSHRRHALVYLDLDQFKIVNDTCGHTAGDDLLRQITGVLQNGLRAGDILARLGGDEFGVLLLDCPLETAVGIAEALCECIKMLRFVWAGKAFTVGASIGVVAVSSDVKDAGEILRAADLSCYVAKDMGRNRVHVYQPSDSVLAQRQNDMRMTTLIQAALKNNEFCLFRQQLRWLADGPLRPGECWEVLLRLKGSNGELTLPESFLPSAERYDLVPAIDRWVIEHTFASLAAVAHGDHPPGMVSINLSGASFVDPGLLDYICSMAARFDIDFHMLCFEITETVAISNWPIASRMIGDLKRLGASIALDDFGSGVSSFSYLKKLPVDFLKIDGSFVHNLVSDPLDRAMVEATTRIGHLLGIFIIAEWVEDEATLAALREIGVDGAQGFYIGVPEALPG
ncbi:MAG: EAL domain-containing protein [Gammaproteobacteria bacterium]|nr:EAL domain-containing protein [Gammaproteobacteria bacterium]